MPTAIYTELPAGHPVLRLCSQLDRAIVESHADHDVALSALLTLYVDAAKRHRCCAVSSLKQLHSAAALIAAVHFPELQFDEPQSTPH